MISAIKDNWWHIPNESPPDNTEYAWRPIEKYCVQDNGKNTGFSAYNSLEQYNVVTSASTGVTKPNAESDPDYVAPFQDNAVCPVSIYGWEGYQPYCVIEEETAGTPQPPAPNCRVHFSGGILSDQIYPQGNEFRFTKIYVEDDFSEFVGAGEYPDNEIAFPKAVANSFDGIAIDSGTRLEIWSGKNYTGVKLLDVGGPALMYNVRWNTPPTTLREYQDDKLRTFSEPLQSTYPQSKRYWSYTDMHTWGTGSCKITCR